MQTLTLCFFFDVRMGVKVLVDISKQVALSQILTWKFVFL